MPTKNGPPKLPTHPTPKTNPKRTKNPPRYLFVSNSDNLGATLDLDLLSYFASSGAAFLMEVCERTGADKKGGHLARRKADGKLLLRESEYAAW